MTTPAQPHVAQARKSPEFLKNAVVYQLFLRPFTPEGTLKAAAAHLPRLAALGVDIVYLCPIALQDDDPRPEFWSPRQLESGFNNPQNPYRVKDYFNIDPEYGTDADLKDFVNQAHSLGMRVTLDIVYLHCGPTAVFIKSHPDFVRRDSEGKVINERWNFPQVNFESPELREYLWRNMEYFIKEFHVDGYRCDVGPEVPLDFWEEGRRRIEALDPDCIMICEGDRKEDQLSAFDLNYGFAWEYGLIALFRGEKTALDLQKLWQDKRDEFPQGSRFLRIFDNHDIAQDCGANRHEIAFGNHGVEAALLINFAMDGVPYLYNGMEIADAAPHSIFANRFHGKDKRIDWAQADTPVGKARQEFVGKLISLRHTQPALTDGAVEWRENDQLEQVVSFSRESATQKLLLVVNASNQARTVNIRMNAKISPRSLMQRSATYQAESEQLHSVMEPYGYLVLEY